MGSQRAASACCADRALGLCGSSSHKTGGASGSPQAGSKEQGPCTGRWPSPPLRAEAGRAEDSKSHWGLAAADSGPAGTAVTFRDSSLGSGHVRRPGSQGSHGEAHRERFQGRRLHGTAQRLSIPRMREKRALQRAVLEMQLVRER